MGSHHRRAAADEAYTSRLSQRLADHLEERERLLFVVGRSLAPAVVEAGRRDLITRRLEAALRVLPAA